MAGRDAHNSGKQPELLRRRVLLGCAVSMLVCSYRCSLVAIKGPHLGRQRLKPVNRPVAKHTLLG